jgi:flagellin
MANIINTNVASLMAQNSLSTSQTSLQSSLARLSSGLRINSAKDDAAGLAITDRMTSQIRGLNQAARNANDAISLAATAESSLSSITDNLQRLRELAVQSSNASNSATDRASLQAEASQLLSEIDRVSTTTQFNGVNLLDGSFSKQNFQVGANSNQTIGVSLTGATLSQLGSSAAASVTADGNATALATGDLVINGVSVSNSVSSTDSASTASQASSGIAKAAAINAVSAQTGVTAIATAAVSSGALATMVNAVSTGTITINGVAVTVAAGANNAQTRSATVSAINLLSGQSGVSASDSGTDAGGIVLTAADGRNIVTSSTVLSATFGIATGTTYGGYTLSSSSAITISTTGSIASTGLVAGSYATQTAFANTIAGQSSTALVAGDVTINGVVIGASLAAYDTASSAGNTLSAISKAGAINAVSSQTGVKAVATNATGGGTGIAFATTAASAATITINGVATATITATGTASTDRALIVSAINLISGQTGVQAVDLGGTAANKSIQLTAADGRNMTFVNGFGSSAAIGFSVTNPTYGTVQLSSAAAFTIGTGPNATANVVMTNLGIAAGTYGTGRTGQALTKVDISTSTGAAAAIVAVDNALAAVSSNRANLGAYQNRFLSTISNLQGVSTSLTAARSRIQDADFAAETSNLSRANILQQAGTAMLAQANALPQQVLTLLR